MARSRIGYDKDGKKLGVLLPENEKRRRKDVFINVVSCFVVYQSKHADGSTLNKILIEKRSSKGLLNPNAFDLVSGHVDDDEIGIQAMYRELAEEVGIDLRENPEKLKNIGKYSMTFDEIGNYFVDFYCTLIESRQGIELQEDEVDEIEWIDLEEAFKMIQEGRTRFPKNFDYTEIFKKVKEKLNIEKNEPMLDEMHQNDAR